MLPLAVFTRNVLRDVPMLNDLTVFDPENVDDGPSPIPLVRFGIQVKNHKIAFCDDMREHHV